MSGGFLEYFKDLFKRKQERQSMRDSTAENIAETERLLTLDGEDEWMLNLCRTPKKGVKECLPNDKND